MQTSEMLYSAAENAFYPAELVPMYKAAGTFPADAKTVTPEVIQAFYETPPPAGKRLAAGDDGLPLWMDVDPPTPEQIEADRNHAVQMLLDSTARQYRYDDMRSACTYADEPCVPSFQREGVALRAWRSLVWKRVGEIFQEVQQELRAMPSEQALLDELPKFELQPQVESTSAS